MLTQKEKQAREVAAQALGVPEERFLRVKQMGGITNENFYLATAEEEVMLRLPGKCTETLDRSQEEKNAAAAARAGLNPRTLYFSRQTGVKITRYIRGAVTLDAALARKPEIMCKSAALLRKLHETLPPFENVFDPFALYDAYLAQDAAAFAEIFPGFAKSRRAFAALRPALEALGLRSCPCHNDTLAENLVMERDGGLYLIDWEYSGQNDPMWDVAGHMLESGFSAAQQEQFLRLYLGAPPSRQDRQKALLFQICQDLLWSVQTMAKTLAGEDQYEYALGRYGRAQALLQEYGDRYGAL
ncbi:phosphotransferase family protein [Anaerofilum sp. BX8]|uniref:Phosphotransferase family protein n=1 Tax=Anaerofilum hominis TaxID=2763016 RepID=A0A923I6W3_9FIRM|nr:choline/ethanolamine kinase family protein [Anaerofilum hominis]MBC5581386.1 phosphotransferase family protein [Anaerofilum hominis]